MTPATVRVSVVIPAFNAEPYLAEAIQSVLDQGIPIIEVVVVDDGSTDGTPGIAAAFGARVALIRQPNAGIGAARNAGVERSAGNLLAFLDADDVWPAGSLGSRIAVLDADPEADGVFGFVQEFHDGGDDLPPQSGALAGTLLIRREKYEVVGRFDENLTVGEFIDWMARAQEAGLRFRSVPDVVLRRRLHATNTGVVRRDARVEYTRVLRAALERRRHQS
ncbi:MAG: glycosyltransferase family 2 protein [Dehalococcoidia bacterium]|nr:glycosyltransferase family 2 protein [Dehalococcoidia bacterium]